MDGSYEQSTRPRQDRPVARSYPPRSVQVESQEDERVNHEAVGKGRRMLCEGPTDVIAPDYMADVMAQRHEHRQEDQTV